MKVFGQFASQEKKDAHLLVAIDNLDEKSVKQWLKNGANPNASYLLSDINEEPHKRQGTGDIKQLYKEINKIIPPAENENARHARGMAIGEMGLKSPLQLACEKDGQDSLTIVNRLLAKGADPNHFMEAQNTPLNHIAGKNSIDQHDLAKVDALVKKGADLELKPDQHVHGGETVLHVAAGKGHASLASHLLSEHGMNPNVRDTYGATPIFHAITTADRNKGAREGAKEVIKDLELHGADLNARPDQGIRSTAMEYGKKVEATREIFSDIEQHRGGQVLSKGQQPAMAQQAEMEAGPATPRAVPRMDLNRVRPQEDPQLDAAQRERAFRGEMEKDMRSVASDTTVIPSAQPQKATLTQEPTAVAQRAVVEPPLQAAVSSAKQDAPRSSSAEHLAKLAGQVGEALHGLAKAMPLERDMSQQQASPKTRDAIESSLSASMNKTEIPQGLLKGKEMEAAIGGFKAAGAKQQEGQPSSPATTPRAEGHEKEASRGRN